MKILNGSSVVHKDSVNTSYPCRDSALHCKVHRKGRSEYKREPWRCVFIQHRGNSHVVSCFVMVCFRIVLSCYGIRVSGCGDVAVCCSSHSSPCLELRGDEANYPVYTSDVITPLWEGTCCVFGFVCGWINHRFICEELP